MHNQVMEIVRGVGVDLIEIDRIKRALGRWGSTFEERILTAEEMELKKRAGENFVFLAGRFAAKEAVFKSLGMSPYWQRISILKKGNGQPVVSFSKEFSDYIKRGKVKKILVSISHSKKYAIAQAITLG